MPFLNKCALKDHDGCFQRTLFQLFPNGDHKTKITNNLTGVEVLNFLVWLYYVAYLT